MGDGINDAPALKIADVSLAVDEAVDVARDAADIILLQRSLHIIVDGIAQGRIVFADTVKYIKSTLSANFGNFYSVAISSLFIDYLPILPLQILTLNLISDFPMISISTDTVAFEDIQRPQKYDFKDIALLTTILGIVSSIFDFITFRLFYAISPAVLQTNRFIVSVFTELWLIYSIRTSRFFLRAPAPSYQLIILTALAGIIALLTPFTQLGRQALDFIRPTNQNLATIFTIVVCYFVTTEVVKLIYYKTMGNNSYSK